MNIETAREIIRYGKRIKEWEIDEVTHQFHYYFDNFSYLITMHRGEIITCFLLA